MADRFGSELRSRIMSRVRSKDTGAEMSVRRLAHKLGYRFRLHQRKLPGSPDIVFPSRRKVVFVHGCFWHQHNCTRGDRIPRTNTEYWIPKLQMNKQRDQLNQSRLLELGWEALVIWECEIRKPEITESKLKTFLESR